MRHRKKILAAIAAVCLASCQSLDPPVERPGWRVGDTWNYRRTTTAVDRTKPETVVQSRQFIRSIREGRIEVAANEVMNGGSKQVVVALWNADGGVLRSTREGQATMVYQPPFSLYSWPVKPGQEWALTSYIRSDDGRHAFATTVEVRVVGWETVRVPAGAYRALKMEIASTHSDRVHTSQATLWFAPQVKRQVKLVDRKFERGRSVSTTVQELLSFAPGPP